MDSDSAVLYGISLELLPPTIRELIEAVGLNPAMALAEHFGGLTLNVPLGDTKVGQAALDNLATKIGDEAASLIAARYGGTRLYIPNCKQSLKRARDARMLEDKKAMRGASEKEIVRTLARRYNLSDRYVWRILRMPGVPPAKNRGAQALVAGRRGETATGG